MDGCQDCEDECLQGMIEVRLLDWNPTRVFRAVQEASKIFFLSQHMPEHAFQASASSFLVLYIDSQCHRESDECQDCEDECLQGRIKVRLLDWNPTRVFRAAAVRHRSI
jgi:NAD-dependent dihydropyrimidine dehydrogenase PreA subunit